MRRRSALATTSIDLYDLAKYARATRSSRPSPIEIGWPVCETCKRVTLAAYDGLVVDASAATAIKERYMVDRVNLEAKHTGDDGSWVDVRAWHHGQEQTLRIEWPGKVDFDTPHGEEQLNHGWRSLVYFHPEITRERA